MTYQIFNSRFQFFFSLSNCFFCTKDGDNISILVFFIWKYDSSTSFITYALYIGTCISISIEWVNYDAILEGSDYTLLFSTPNYVRYISYLDVQSRTCDVRVWPEPRQLNWLAASHCLVRPIVFWLYRHLL